MLVWGLKMFLRQALQHQHGEDRPNPVLTPAQIKAGQAQVKEG